MLFINATLVSAGKAENPILTCPKGYVLIGENCRSKHVKDLVPYCGNDEINNYELVNDMCYDRVAFRKQCENGRFNEEYDMCVETSISAPIVTCPADYDFVSSPKKGHDGKKLLGYCEKAVSLAGPSVCPWGTKPEGKRCASYQKVTPFWNCPAGTKPRGQFCAHSEKYDCSEPIVPIAKKSKKSDKKRRLGEKKDLRVFTVGIDGLMEAPELVAIKRTCIRETMIPAVMQCPQGAAQKQTDCVVISYYETEEQKGSITYESVPASPVCPAEYRFCDTKKNGGMCCKNVETKPYRFCDFGYVKEDGHCVRAFEPVYICPVEKKLRKGNACDQYDWKPAEAMVTMYVEDNKKKYDVVIEQGKKSH